GEDPIGGEGLFFAIEVRRGGRQVGAAPGPKFLFAAAVAAVEPELVTATAAACEEVAGAQILNAGALRLEHLEAIASGRVAFAVQRPQILVCGDSAALGRARLGAIEDDPVAVHAAD